MERPSRVDPLEPFASPRRPPLAAIVTLASGALTGVTPAANGSGGGSGDGSDYDVTIPLTERTTDELTDGPNTVKARGAADKMRHDGRIYLSLPVRGTDDHRAARGRRRGPEADLRRREVAQPCREGRAVRRR